MNFELDRSTLIPITLVILLLSIFAAASTLRSRPDTLQLMPGPEGLQAGTYGFQPHNVILDVYATNETLPQPFLWSDSPVDPYNAKIKRVPQDFENFDPEWYRGELLVERQQPYPDRTLETRQITYWIKVGRDAENNTVWRKVVGIVVPWTFVVEISSVPHPDMWAYRWADHSVWMAMGTVKWDRAYQDPDDPTVSSDAGWSIPLTAYIEKYDPYGPWTEANGVNQRVPETAWVTSNAQIHPSFDGRTVTLYGDPEYPASLDDLWYAGDYQGMPDFSTLNSSLVNNPLPSSEFQNHVYFRFSMSALQPYVVRDWLTKELTEVWYPSVYFRFRVYYLELGVFTYVQEVEEIPPWQQRGWQSVFMGSYWFWDSIFKALNVLNPFSVFGEWAGLVAFIAIVIVILIAIYIVAKFLKVVVVA